MVAARARLPFTHNPRRSLEMSRSVICIDDKILTRIFKGSPREFVNLATATQQAPLASGVLDPPRNEYPLFEHLIVWLYGRSVYYYLEGVVRRLTQTQMDQFKHFKIYDVRANVVNLAEDEPRGSFRLP